MKSSAGVKSGTCCEIVTVGRRAARGGEVEVTELDPKSSTLLPMWSLSIMEAFLTSSTSRNSLEQRFHRCEQTVHTPSRHHHACAVRRVRRRPGKIISTLDKRGSHRPGPNKSNAA